MHSSVHLDFIVQKAPELKKKVSKMKKSMLVALLPVILIVAAVTKKDKKSQ